MTAPDQPQNPQPQNPPAQAPPPAAPASPATPGRTFTQEDVDRIVGERLARDRAARAEAPPPAAPPAPATSAGTDTPVFSELIAQAVSQAVQQAVAPLQQRFAQDDQARAQQAFDAALGERAGQVLTDVRDAALLDRAALLDANGNPDPARIDAALQQLVTDRPHLRKQATAPQSPASPLTPGAASVLGAPTAQGTGFGDPAVSKTPEQAAADLRARYSA